MIHTQIQYQHIFPLPFQHHKQPQFDIRIVDLGRFQVSGCRFQVGFFKID